jgi:uncharacterized protein
VTDFLAALALALIIEGLVYAAFPERVKTWLALLIVQPPMRIRAVALTCAAAGLVLLWAVRG